MKINASKKPKFYLKNSYASQIMKPQIQNIQNSPYSENSKTITNINISQSINFNPKKIFFNKKTLYQNCYSNKSNLIKAKSNFLSQKKYQNKSTKKYKENPLSLGINIDTTISGRKTNSNNYEIINPLKERSNSENKLNSFNRTYTFFNNNNSNNHISYIKNKANIKNKVMKKSVDKMSLNLTDIYYQNLSTNLNKLKKEKNSYSAKNYISPIKNKNNNKKYFYQDKLTKDIGKEKNIYSKLQKKLVNSMSPLTSNNIENKSITSPNSNNNSSNTLKITKNNGRIQKYILNNLSDKRKIKSRQFFRQYIPLSKSTGVNNDNIIKYQKQINSPNKDNYGKIYIDNTSIINSPSLPSISSNMDDNNNSININKKYIWMKKNKNININTNYLYNNKGYGLRNNIRNHNNIKNNNLFNLRYNLSLNSTLEGFFTNFDKNDINGIEEKDLFEQSAITIQSAFRGYLVKTKFERNLCNFKDYNKGYEILEKIIYLLLHKKLNLIKEKKYFLNYLILLKNQNYFCNKSYSNYKLYKTFNLSDLPCSPLSEKNSRYTKHYMDLYLHKEIGERFNIIKENKNKELEKKFKEELDGVNNKMNELIEENNKLKDINNKIKYKESKYNELSKDNKKKDNIINIITNDNQNLAKKLKIIKDKNQRLEIHNQLNLFFNCENNQYNSPKELFIKYRNFYLLFLIHKKNIHLLDLLRRYFNRYKNIINIIRDNKNINLLLREQKLLIRIKKRRNKEYNILQKNFLTFYYKGLINDKEIENRNNILRTKLINIVINKEKTNKIIIKSNFHKFYYKGVISNLIEEKNKNLIDKKIENENKIKKLFISMEQRKDKHNFLIKRDCFDKWSLFSKILGMKAVTDEKKRKKRQKQRMKKKIENRSANKYLTNNNNILHLGKNNNYILNKEKDKDILTCLEHSVTTDFSGAEINSENKDKLMKATEKLSEIFYKSAINYKAFENKNKLISSNSEINENEKNNKKEIIKNDNNENDNEYEEDSGDSFGI